MNGINTQVILALAAAGYTGADFIEGIMSRYEPSPPPAPQPQQQLVPVPAPAKPLNAKG